MQTFIAYIVFILALAAIVLLKREFDELKNFEIKNLIVLKRLHYALDILIVVPVLAVIVICIILAIFFKHDLLSRITHGIFVLSLWMIVVGMSFSEVFKVKINKKFSAIPAEIAAVFLILIVYFTPIFRFRNLYQNISSIIPFSIGIFIILYIFFMLLSLKIELRLPVSGKEKNR